MRLLRGGLLFAVLAALSTGIPASAGIVWNLNASFTDGGTASGSFLWDALTDTIGAYSISVSGGNTTAFPPVAYTNADSSFSWSLFIGDTHNTFLFQLNGSSRQLRFTPVADLTNAGGTVAVDLNTAGGGSGSIECFNCGTYRLMSGGSLTSAATSAPEPAAGAMVLAALGAMAALGRRLSGKRAR